MADEGPQSMNGISATLREQGKRVDRIQQTQQQQVTEQGEQGKTLARIEQKQDDAKEVAAATAKTAGDAAAAAAEAAKAAAKAAADAHSAVEAAKKLPSCPVENGRCVKAEMLEDRMSAVEVDVKANHDRIERSKGLLMALSPLKLVVGAVLVAAGSATINAIVRHLGW